MTNINEKIKEFYYNKQLILTDYDIKLHITAFQLLKPALIISLSSSLQKMRQPKQLIT